MREQRPEEDRLERLVGDTMRDLPARPAPRTLESRVLGELQRRASRPWWSRSFGHWPMLARVGLMTACGALIGITLLGGPWTVGMNSLQDTGAMGSWVRQAAAITGTVGNLVASLVDAVPTAWLLLGLTAASLLYVFLFGLGAAAYRLLYVQPHDGR
jgi:anti-sigma factor RsiW